ncbi:unnamed protein product [Tuber melanosporum]|uniref:(Perigord truffle) hypothetical protein n=1 Tax=Tuber melanosporum (strain Mel28) TaxID=656061 RepID=D5GIJ6_TUBMM|nr:uncharacterized protein GSTUM_00008528001 [Tuber melanosporum]CAZ84339.1 unnamed protein product [Tuber melanosporum]
MPAEEQQPLSTQLVQRLLTENFEDRKTRISQPALNVVQEYTKIFVREAIWRAAAIRKEEQGGEGGLKNMSAFLEA